MRLLEQARERPLSERTAFLIESCGEDEDLRRKVEALLRHDESFAESETLCQSGHADLVSVAMEWQSTEAEDVEVDTSSRIGPFEVVRKLGEGGMGVVFAARREGSDELVALKIIRPGLESGDVFRRFRREAQVLGQLRHPGIASFKETGKARVLTRDGETRTHHFLAMEYVDGSPVLEFADRKELADGDRLELMARICDAVHHAHEREVIHRDLKPSNILVAEDDGVGQPKILDFGIAYVADLGGETLTRTQTGAFLGTLPYMSPEQVSGDSGSVDSRSDVYSLGVLLFELLSGRLPYDVRGQPLPVAARIIQVEDPTRLGSVVIRFRGTVETIVGKALEKDPGQRYRSAADFAADLRNHLWGRPTRAQAPTWTRRFKKFVRRHPTVSASLLVLVLGFMTTVWFALQERRSRGEAEKNLERARAATHRASIRAATAALDLGDIATAKLHLEQEDAGLGDSWTSRHLRSRLDQSIAALPVEEVHFGEVAFDVESSVLHAVVTKDGRGQHYSWDTDHRLLGRRDFSVGRMYLDRTGKWIHRVEPEQIRILDATNGETRYVLPIESGGGASLYSWRIGSRTDRGYVLSVKRDGLFLWDVDRSDFSPLFPVESPVTGTPDGDGAGVWFAVPCKDQLWLFRDEETVESFLFEIERQFLRVVEICPDGSRLATGGKDGRVRIWKLGERSSPELAHVLSEPTDSVKALRVSHDGTRLAGGGEDRRIRIWDLRTGELLQNLTGHQGTVLSVAFSPDDQRLASLSLDGSVRTWNVHDSDPRVLQNDGFLYVAEFSRSGERFLTGCSDGGVRVYDAESSVEIGRFPSPIEAGKCVHDVSLSPDEKKIAIGYRKTLAVMSLVTGEELFRLPKELGGDRCKVAFSADGTRLATHLGRAGLALWKVEDWSLVATSSLTIDSKRRSFLRYSADGGRIAAANQGGIELLDPETLVSRREIRFEGAEVLGIAFSSDGRLLAAGLSDATIRVVALGSRKKPAVLHGHSGRVFCVEFSPDGRRLFSGANDRTIRVWDVDELVEITQLLGHGDYVYDLGVSPDGERLVSASGDETVRLWETTPLSDRFRSMDDYEAAVRRVVPRLERDLASRGLAEAYGTFIEDPDLTPREKEIARQSILSRALKALKPPTSEARSSKRP